MTWTTGTYALLSGVIPAVVWLLFWLREDTDHPEPRWLIACSFLGGAISVIVAIFAEKYVGDLVSDQNTRYTLWAAVEEIVKLATVSIIALNSSYNDEPIDAMMYIITVALGFSAIENALFILAPLSTGNIAQGIATDSMRFVGATLVHVVASAVIGFSIGAVMYKKWLTRAIVIGAGIIGAVAIHAAFNITIVSGQSSAIIRTFMWIWIGVVFLIILFEEVKSVREDGQRKTSTGRLAR